MMDRRPPRLQRIKPLGIITLPPKTSFTQLSLENKIIQSVWIGPRLSAMESLCIRSFLSFGHAFHLYLYGPCEGVPKGTIVKDANEIINHSEVQKYRSTTIFSDLFRYMLLQKGISVWYVDMDTIALRPFDFTESYIFASEYLQNGQRLVDNGILKIPKDSELLKEAIKRCGQQDPMNPSGNLSHGALAMGPELMTVLAEEYDLLSYVKTPSVFTGIVPWEIPNAYIDQTVSIDLSAAYATHMWQSRWTTTGKNKDEVYHSHSLYEQLKRRYPETEHYFGTNSDSLV
jgi:hypothetical protein